LYAVLINIYSIYETIKYKEYNFSFYATFMKIILYILLDKQQVITFQISSRYNASYSLSLFLFK